MAQQQRHFFDRSQVSWDLIRDLVQKGADHPGRGANRHAWAAILRCYFPSYFEIPPGQPLPITGTKYCVMERPILGLQYSSIHAPQPDVAVLQMTTTIQPSGRGTPGTKRDALWVECKAPIEDQPDQWITLMDEAINRLNSLHPTQKVYFILSLGLKWMIFCWDPLNPAPSGKNLRMMDASGHEQKPRDVDPRVRPVHTAGVTQVIHGQDLIENGIIYTDRAKTTDYITTAIVNGETVLKYQDDLNFLEHCLSHVAGEKFVGDNESDYT